MNALILTEPGQAIVTSTIPPVVKADHVLLRVRMVGLCGSDLNSFRGKNPMVSYPRIPGHEISAEIVETGADVPSHLKIGTAVTLSPYSSCGQCASCRRGRVNACQFNQTLGVQRDGALTELISVPWKKLLTVSGLGFRELCMVEPLTVGFHASARGRVTASDTVVVLGCGMVGLGAIAACTHKQARVIAVDVDDSKLALAVKAGAHEVLNSRQVDVAAEVTRLTGDGADVVIEAIGLPETFRSAVDLVAFTGRVVYIGYAKEAVTFETRLFVQKELDILGSRNATEEDFAGVIELLSKRTFPLNETISRIVSLKDAPAAFEDWARDPIAISKILVEVS